MKHVFALLAALLLVVSLAACSGENPSSGAEPPVSASESDSTPSEPVSTPSEAPDASETPDAPEAPEEDAPASQPEDAEGGGALVAYFSWSGNTRQVAEIIAEETGAELFEIAPAAPYTDDYDTLLDVAQQEQGENARPALGAQVENWDGYDTIFLGYPNWWSDAPMAVYTFLESYDFTGKTLIPFNTSASGGFGRSLTGIEESAAGAAILEGLDLTERELGDAQSRVTAWLESLDLRG